MINNRISPFLYNLSQRYEYIAPINSEPYSTWTTGGTLVTHCGIPQILPDSSWGFRNQKKFLYNKNIVCLSDILASIGYKRIFALTGTENVMGFGEWRNYKNFSKLVSKRNDFKLSCFIADEVLPKMNAIIRKKVNNIIIKSKRRRRKRINKKVQSFGGNGSRYMVYIRPEDTHIPYKRPR